MDPNSSKRRIESRVEKILHADLDTIYVQDPWFFKDFGDKTKAVFTKLSDDGDINTLNTTSLYTMLMNLYSNRKIGFVIDPAWDRVVEFFRGLEKVEMHRVL
jgi:hypothetical protein